MKSIDQFLFQQLSLYRMRRLSQTLGGIAEAALAQDQKIRLHDWRILAVLLQQPGITATRAGPAVLLNKMQTSRAVAHLAELGLLTVSPSDTDGRAAHLELTEAGRSVLESASRRMAALEMWALEDLEATELDQLDRILAKIEQRVSRTPRPGAVGLDQTYERMSRSRRVRYLFEPRGDEYDASKP